MDTGFKSGDLTTFCKKIPKIELHAHLNGSLSSQTLDRLYKLQNSDKCEQFSLEKYETLSDMFEVFSIAHALTTTVAAVFEAAYHTIKEFYEDNVIYLELRSTPRSEKGMTKKEYITAILDAIKAVNADGMDITVNLLVSINRKQGLQAAKENVHLAMEMCKDNPEIRGIDLSGDPTTGNAFVELLAQARSAGLKIAAHCAEVANEKETLDILKFKPDRLGHCTCIHPSTHGSEIQFQTLLESKIPVELCLTSNVKCKTIAHYKSHHFQHLYKANHPICICTDDKGVFNTILSKEIELVCQHFDLTKENIVDIMKKTVNYIFDSESNRVKLLGVIDKFEY